MRASKYRKINPEQRQALIWDYRRYVPLKTIAAKYGVSLATVSKIAKLEG